MLKNKKRKREAEAAVKEAVVKALADTEAAKAVVVKALADTEAALKALIEYFDDIQNPLMVGKLSTSQFIKLKNHILKVYDATTGKRYSYSVDDDTDDDATIVPG